MLPKIEGLLQRLLRYSAEGRGFMLTCAGLALTGTITAAYPVTAVVVPATLLAPRNWRRITLFTALGSALGATVLVLVIHHMGWANLYEHYPQLATHPDWRQVMSWVQRYGIIALFLIALSPLPQTPALIFFGITRQDYIGIFIAMLAGKILKYGLFAWATNRFPEKLGSGFDALWQRLSK